MHDITVHLLLNGKHEVASVEKVPHGCHEKFDIELFKLRMVLNGTVYLSGKVFDDMEYAIIDLQKQLPDDILILCCLSCRYGNFCPYGGRDDEIFCLIDHIVKDKMDVAGIMSTSEAMQKLTRNPLLFWCEKYHRIDAAEGFYTYNDWEYYINY